jgi:hypothetical protein
MITNLANASEEVKTNTQRDLKASLWVNQMARGKITRGQIMQLVNRMAPGEQQIMKDRLNHYYQLANGI